MSAHFNARIVIEKISKEEPRPYSGGQVKEEGKREVVELMSVNLKDSELDKLLERAANHLGLARDL